MSWSQLKKKLEALLAPSLRGPLEIHVTEYTRKNAFDVGRGWITFDGKEVVSVQIPTFYSDNFRFPPGTMDFGQAVHEYLALPVSAARASSDELLVGFSFLDRRTGKRTLKGVRPESLHPFARILYELRCRVEGLEGELRVPAGKREATSEL